MAQNPEQKDRKEQKLTKFHYAKPSISALKPSKNREKKNRQTQMRKHAKINQSSDKTIENHHFRRLKERKSNYPPTQMRKRGTSSAQMRNFTKYQRPK